MVAGKGKSFVSGKYKVHRPEVNPINPNMIKCKLGITSFKQTTYGAKIPPIREATATRPMPEFRIEVGKSSLL